ncbi:MAG: glycosyltransferase [Candidatus Methylomirabilia bacterium]
MNVLLLAPQPFYRERGTPIAVRLLAETLCALGHAVDLLVYHEGEAVSFPGLRLLRAPAPPLVRDVPIGFSAKKLACDVALTASFLRLARPGRYDVVHAVEEAIFPAAWLRRRHRAAVVCDMDSDMVDQLVGASKLRGRFRRPLEAIVRRTLGACDLVLAVCPSLADKARGLCPTVPVRILEDIPLTETPHAVVEDLRARFAVRGPLALYVGNLEPYQGIDLLLAALAALGAEPPVTLVVIGGTPADIARYAQQAAALGLIRQVHFAGPRPVRELGGYLAQADILVSPRTFGENTPMKIYSYLAAGRGILATDIGSHTQALDASCAVLVRPDPGCVAAGLRRLAEDRPLRERLGQAGAARAAARYSRPAYREKLAAAYALLEAAPRARQETA